MKETPSDFCQVVDNYDYGTPSGRNLEGDGKAKWYKKIPWDKIEPLIPRLRYVRGSKARIALTTFEEIGQVCQQIFECNKSFFRFRAQVDLLAHYLGTRMLEQMYIVRQNKGQTPLSKYLESMEHQYVVWDQMKAVKDIVGNLCEKKVQGFVKDDEIFRHVSGLISTFVQPAERKRMEEIINTMMNDGEYDKAKERLRKNTSNHRKAVEKGFHVVD